MDGPLAAASRIEIAGLVCRFGAVSAIDDVSFVVPAGSICGVAGPNGAGKSTLLRALAGAIGPAAGVVLVGGRTPQSMPTDELARLLAVLPQRPVAPAGITVREAVGWGRHPHLARLSHPGPDDLRAIDGALASTATQHLADRPLEALSGGELHRVLIARALAQTPRILLFDEPTVHLDIAHQVEVMELLRRLAAGGLTVVAALHDLNLAAAYCDLMALLAGGRLLAFGHPASVVRADLIAQAYGTAVSVRANPVTGRPYLTLTGAGAREATGPRVHVVGGGGTAAGLITRYTELGYRVSLGVVHVMDTDDETAHALGLQVIEEAPFSPVGAAAAAAASEAARAAVAVVIAPVPIGAGNLLNLEVAAAALANGVPVIMVAGVETRDFTGGEAARRAAGLVAAGARVVPDLPAAIEAVRQLAPVVS